MLVLVIALAAVLGPGAPEARADDSAATYADIEKTLGQVPRFFRVFPAEAIPGAWEAFKGLQLNPNTALSGKVKELIGLAVSAQVPCRYCVYFHTKAAAAGGAGEREIGEALVMASLTRKWSTVLNGLQIEDGAFRAEVKRVFAHVKKGKPAAAPVAIVDAASAYADMERTLGLVPTFFRRFPPAAIAGAWREYKAVELSPTTALSGKHKELIGLAVSAQIPCKYCVFFHTEAARLNGANEDEIREAVAMAAAVRHWSTFLNGALIDEAEFRREVDQIMGRAARADTKPR
jgi:AhpD family alkylhydroperoxidase